MRLAELRIFLFDRGEAIFPSRPQFNCAAVSSGGRRRSSPHGTSCSASHVPYSVWEAEAGRPSKTVLSASSQSLILLTKPPRRCGLFWGRSACYPIQRPLQVSLYVPVLEQLMNKPRLQVAPPEPAMPN